MQIHVPRTRYRAVPRGAHYMVLLGTIVKGVSVRRMKASASPPLAEDGDSMRKRILGAAFKLFVEKGYAGTSTLEVATCAKVSKRDLYASVGNKQAMLVAGITGRTAKMQLRPELPVPRGRRELASILNAYATRLMAEVSHPTVIATRRFSRTPVTCGSLVRRSPRAMCLMNRSAAPQWGKYGNKILPRVRRSLRN